MWRFLLLIISASATLYLVLLIRSYGYMSIAELGRRVKSKDLLATKVYRARKHGLQLWIILWCAYGFSLSAVILLIDSYLHVALAIVIDVMIILTMHVIVPWARWPKPSLKMAAQSSGVVVRSMRYTRPILKSLDKVFGSWIELEGTTRIHSKEELLEVLQKIPGDLDKVGRDELRIATHALSFGDKIISEVMTPRAVVEMVDADDELTPVRLGELHDSGFSRFPVFEGSRENLVGVFYLKDVTNIRRLLKIKDHMRTEVYYVNEATNLDQVLNAFLLTQHHLFIVVNRYEEIVGVITIEDVIEQIIGRSIIDEFDKYEDLREVAKQKADEISRHRSAGSQTNIADI